MSFRKVPVMLQMIRLSRFRLFPRPSKWQFNTHDRKLLGGSFDFGRVSFTRAFQPLRNASPLIGRRLRLDLGARLSSWPERLRDSFVGFCLCSLTFLPVVCVSRKAVTDSTCIKIRANFSCQLYHRVTVVASISLTPETANTTPVFVGSSTVSFLLLIVDSPVVQLCPPYNLICTSLTNTFASSQIEIFYRQLARQASQSHGAS